MTRKMTATEIKAHILSVLDEVAAGDQVDITKRGRTVARLVPARGPHALRGRFSGVAITADAKDELFTTALVWNLP